MREPSSVRRVLDLLGLHHAVDRTLCDDKQLKAAQDSVWTATKEIVKTILWDPIDDLLTPHLRQSDD